MDNVEIGLFVPAAYVVDLPYPACFEHKPDGTAMVLHVEPITNLLAVTIDRQLLACQRVVNDQRNELFRELVRAVVVGAVSREHRQTVGVVVGTHQVVAGSFAGRIGAIGLVAIRFPEGRVIFL
jgi:hypothetical protein